jgi:thymidylate kinase
MLELSSPPSREAAAIIAAFLPRRARGERAVSDFVRRLRRNRYPLLSLESTAAQHPLLSPSVAWRDALKEDRQSLEEQRDEFAQVKRAWSDAGIASVLFKSGGIAPSFPYTSDNVDVLVPHNRTMEARRILLAMGYVWLRNIDQEQKWLFRKFHKGRSVSAIRVHGWVGWDVEFHERAIWDGVRQSSDDSEAMVPSREDALLINAANALYENKEIHLYDLEKIRAQWCAGLDWEYIEGIARRRGWLDGLYFALLVCQKLERDLFGYCTAPPDVVAAWRRGLRDYPLQWAYWQKVRKRGLDLPFRVSFAFSKLLYYKKIVRDSHDRARKRASNVVRTLAWGVKQKSGVRPQAGRLIAVSGLDGAGRTAHVRALSSAFQTSEVISRVVWSRCGCAPLSRAPRAVAAGVRPRARDAVTPSSGGQANKPSGGQALSLTPKRGFTRTAWAWANALDLALLYQWKVRLPLLFGKVVICDRYTADAAVEIADRLGISDPMSVPAVRMLMALAPAPGSAYLLDLPAEVAAFRSADPEDVWAMLGQRKLYRRVADAAKMHLLDVSEDFADANDRLVRRALQDYEDNFGTFSNGLLLSNPPQLNPGESAMSPPKPRPALAEPPARRPPEPPEPRRSRR